MDFNGVHSRNLDNVCQWLGGRTVGDDLYAIRVVQLFYLLVVAVVFGGIGSPLGAVVGALVIGLVSQLSVLVVGEAYSTVSVFVVLVVLMLARPNGIIRTRGRSVFTTA